MSEKGEVQMAYILYVGASGGQTPQDLYRPALVFAAANKMAENYSDVEVKVALLGDAVYAVDPIESMKPPHPQPPHYPDRRPKLADLINGLPKGVEIWC
jgi:hypothetical protein